MSIFNDKTSPLGTLWNAGRVTHGRKSHKQKLFEKSLAGIKSNVLFDHLTDAQNDISLHFMSRLLFGFTKIVNIQSSSIYQNSLQLLGCIHREMSIQQKGTDMSPAMAHIPEASITLSENPYAITEHPFDMDDALGVPIETQHNVLATATEQGHGTTRSLSPVDAQPVEPIPTAAEADDQQLWKRYLVDDLDQLNIVDEFAPGPSRQPQPSRSRTHSSLGMNDQIVSTDNDNNMDDYMDWSSLFIDFEQNLPPNVISSANRSNSSSDGYQRVPVISPVHQHLHQNLPNLVSADNAIDVHSPIWDISGLSISPPPATLPPPDALPPPNLAPWMNENDLPGMVYDNNPSVPQLVDSPVMSIRTEDYHQIVPRLASPTIPPIALHRPRRRRRCGVLDQNSTLLPNAAFVDIHAIVIAHPPVEPHTLPTRGPQSRASALKQLVTRYRTQMQQPRMTISRPTNFWLRESRNERQGNTVIEQGRRLEQGRNRDPHSQDDFALSNAGGDSDTHRLSSVDDTNIGQDDYDFDQMVLVDDRQSNASNTSTSSTRFQRQQQQQGRRTSDNNSFGRPFTPSTASDRGQQGMMVNDDANRLEPDYDEVLEMGVYMKPPDLTGQEFYEFLRLSTRDQDDMCIFERVFPKGGGGSKRSEVALAFYHVLACSTLNQIRPEQDEPYGPLHLHLLLGDST